MIKSILCLSVAIICSSYCILQDPEPILAKQYLSKGYELKSNASFDSATFYFEKSAAIYYEQELWQRYAECLNNISTNSYSLGKYDSAIVYAERALKVCKDKISPTDLEAAHSYNALGTIHRIMGNFTLALEYYEQSKNIKIKNLGENHIDVTRAYNNIAIAYTVSGNFDKSIAFFQKAMKIRKKTLSPDHRLLTNAYNNLGAVYMEKGVYDSALIYLNASLAIRKRTLGNHPITGNTLNNIGAVHEMQEDYEPALKYYQEALVIFREVFGERHPLINSTAINIGDVYSKSNQLDKALQYYQDAIISISANFKQSDPTQNPIIESAPNHFNMVPPLSSKASIFEKKYDQTDNKQYLLDALKTIQSCDTAIIKIRQQQQENIDKLALGAGIKATYETAISISFKLYELTEQADYAELLFYFMEQSKSSVLLQATSDLSAKNFGGIPVSLLDKEKALKETQALLKSQTLSDNSSSLQTKLFQVKRSHDSLTSVFENQFPKYYELRYNTNITTISEVQSGILKEDQMLIAYFLNNNKLYLFAISKDDFKIIHSQTDSSFNHHYNQFLDEVKNPVTVSQDIEEFRSYTESAHHLYKIMLAPVEDFISGKDLIIVPDGKLALIPMDALLTKPVDRKSINYQTLPYAIKSHTISYANSSTTLWNGIRSRNTQKNAVNIIAFAPSFSERHLADNNLSSLNWNDEEVKMLDSFFETERYSGSSATESVFKEKVDQYKIIHIASHALIDDDYPMNSKIAFSENLLDSLNDGYLHTFELYNSQINAEMVVLSACNTGAGTVQKGENVMSLGYAFAYAGTPNIMMSHWQIDDKSTYLLMQHFYKNLSEGMTKNKALRNAKLSLMRESGITYANPYYWGAFVFYGDGEPVVTPANYTFYLVIGLIVLVVLSIFLIKKFR